MKEFVADSNYHQFYVADMELEPDAPTEWTENDVAKHHLTSRHIAALSPINDVDARIISCGPSDPLPHLPDKPDFEVITEIEVPSEKVGIYGWPFELRDQHIIPPGQCEILFRGYATDKTETYGDYYLVQVKPKKVEQGGPANRSQRHASCSRFATAGVAPPRAVADHGRSRIK